VGRAPEDTLVILQYCGNFRCLPLNYHDITATSFPYPPKDVNSNPVILLAEDEDTDALLMLRAFRKACIVNPLLRVKDGDEAISYLAGEGIYADRNAYPLPVLLLLDLKMPRRNGFDVLTWIREQPNLQRIPVTVLTSSGENRDVEKAYGLGASSYLQKPSEFLDLIEALKSLKNSWRIVEKPAA
jgi:CheY-like chemotaxis protein